MTTTFGQVDVATIRAAFPIEQIVQQSGVDLRPSGHGFVGCCPFHDDSTPSLSVGGVPDRFTCFGCGARGDVIDFVQKLHGLSFVEAVRSLTSTGAIPTRELPPGIPERQSALTPATSVSAARGFEINQLAWARLSAPIAVSFADSYLRFHRGIDLHALRTESPSAPLVGHVGHGWTTLTEHLRRDGIEDEEMLAMDLARTTRAGRLVDSLRDRLIIPVTDPLGQIHGFIGRDLSEDPRAPKYLNPTRTATFDKGTVVHRPTHHDLSETANVVVVEGALDALAIAAVAARAGRSDDFAPCTTSGVGVTATQAARVVELAGDRPPVIALDGDEAGAEGTMRWLTRIAAERRTPALLTRLPSSVDPADWIREHDVDGLSAFDQSHGRTHPSAIGVAAPGRELARILVATGGDRVDRVVDVLVPVAAALPQRWATELLDEAEREMTRQGWNPNGQFTRALSQALGPSVLGARDRHDASQPLLEARPHVGALPQL